MGPRIFIRGYLSRTTARTNWLSFNGAADFHPRIPRPCNGCGRMITLQWGRGFSSADTQPCARYVYEPLRFNGAADFHPRILVAS